MNPASTLCHRPNSGVNRTVAGSYPHTPVSAHRQRQSGPAPRKSHFLVVIGLLFGVLCAGAPLQAKQSAESFETIKAKAEQGDAEAQLNLGFMYADGEGVPQNAIEAVKCFRKAAEQGDAEAQLNLGFMYANGTEGVPKDAIEAAKWYRKAAEQGDARAQSNLNAMYAIGEGIPKDAVETVKWYHK